MRYKTGNNLEMFHTKYINWQIAKENRDQTGDEIFELSLGGFMNMFNLSYIPKKQVLMVSDFHGLSDTFKFKAVTITKANEIVKSFVDANELHFNNTIYDPNMYKKN